MTKNNTPTEFEDCVALTEYLEILKAGGSVQVFTHTPQETFTRSWGVKTKNKRMGVRKGLPDYVIVTKNNLLFIEMKRLKGGSVKPEQKQWIEALESVGVKAKVCRGFVEAAKFIEANT